MKCICQRAYDTGFTGITEIDRRLAKRYEVYGDDCIRRSYDHYHRGIPYSDAERNPYCFVDKRRGHCGHEACEYARHRPPTMVAKMRWYIEQRCEASCHYPDHVENIDRNGDTRPEMDNVVHLGIQWDERQFQLHHQLAFVPRQPRLRTISVEDFREEIVTALTGLSIDDGQPERAASLDQLSAAGIVQVTHNLELVAANAARTLERAFVESIDEQQSITESVEDGVQVIAA